MRTLEITQKYVTDTEVEAKELIELRREEASKASVKYIIKKAGYEYKTKKAKGEIIAEAWVVTITQIYNPLWEDI